MRLIIGITGATGAIFGVRALQLLREIPEVESHLIVSRWGARTLLHETSYRLKDLRDLASTVSVPGDMGADIASGSFLTNGMLIVPCSMRTLAAIATGCGTNLIHRAADVVLKERRKLVLVARETPLNEVHLSNMLTLTRMGATIFPPSPAFYNHPESVSEVVDHVVVRVLDQVGIHSEHAKRWRGQMVVSDE